jgi:[protein-PII] uridylyltransferase
MTIVATLPSKTVPDQIKEAFLATGDSVSLLAGRTAYVDRVVLEAAAALLFPAIPSGVALLAVGGYGRRHLFPYSDIDLLLLFDNDRLANSSKESISAFLQRLWDSGLRVSQSVRTPAECAEVHDSNIELNVSLLDQRFLGGDRALYATLADRLPKFINGSRNELIRNLGKLTHERHAKFADTFYHLEPNVKETPGGLRDFQLVCWLSQIHGTASGRLTAPEIGPELEQAFRFLARIRCQLHYRASRDANVLTFESQENAAAQARVPEANFMRDYYRHARDVYRSATRLLETQEAQASSLFAQFRDWRSRVSNADFSVTRERVHFRSPQRLDLEPELALDLFRFVARHGIRPSIETEQRIESRLGRLSAHFAQPRPAWPALSEIFSLPHSPMALRAMHETGALTAIFPELRAIECLVVRDFYHRYTVDEHTLVAIQTLWNLRSQQENPLRLYRDLLGEMPNQALLALALLFHDSGKGTPDRNHVEVSEELARSAMSRIQVPPADRDAVLFLIRHHPDLSIALQSRDIYDPQTARDVASLVGTVERLKALTVITYADISAVNPSVMTPWRADQLWQLYMTAYNELTHELQTDRIETLPSGPPRQLEFLEGFPTRYLRTHTDAEIDAHVELEEKSRKRGVAVEIERLESAWRLTFVALDRPFLFASVAGTLSSFRMNILKAEAFANRRGIVLDSFTFSDPGRTLELNPPEIDRLRATVERVILGKAEVKELLKSRPVPALPSRTARIPASVAFNSLAGSTATLVEIVAEDRPGLLYDLATAISSNGANIEVVLIDTQAHKAIDVFYVTAQGQKLSPGMQATLGSALEAACQSA